jgi:hypothetical protein
MAKNPTTRGDADVRERRCTVCDRWLPETAEHFAFNTHYQRYNSWDRDCVKTFVIYRKDNDATTARKLTRKAVLSGKLPEKPARKVTAKKAAAAAETTEPTAAAEVPAKKTAAKKTQAGTPRTPRPTPPITKAAPRKRTSPTKSAEPPADRTPQQYELVAKYDAPKTKAAPRKRTPRPRAAAGDSVVAKVLNAVAATA